MWREAAGHVPGWAGGETRALGLVTNSCAPAKTGPQGRCSQPGHCTGPVTGGCKSLVTGLTEVGQSKARTFRCSGAGEEGARRSPRLPCAGLST